MNEVEPSEDVLAKLYPKSCSNIYCGAYAPKEWWPEIHKALEQIEEIPSIKVAQIKIKFGELRIYIDFPSSDTKATIVAMSIIAAAEAACAKIKTLGPTS